MTEIIRGVVCLIGVAMIGVGAGLIYLPAGLIASGSCLVVLGLIGAMRRINVKV